MKTEILQALGTLNVQRFVYDNQNRLLQSIKLVDEDCIFNEEKLTGLKDDEFPDMIRLITGYEYDILGNKIKEINPQAYGYDSNDTVNREKYTVKYAYDAMNRLTAINRNIMGQMSVRKYTYDADW